MPSANSREEGLAVFWLKVLRRKALGTDVYVALKHGEDRNLVAATAFWTRYVPIKRLVGSLHEFVCHERRRQPRLAAEKPR